MTTRTDETNRKRTRTDRRGGVRRGAGRRAGADWDGSGNYQKMQRTIIGMPPDMLDWLRQQPDGIAGTLRTLTAQAMEEN